MYFYQPIPQLPNQYNLRTSDSCAVQAQETGWTLTDSSTFTNFRKLESVAVRLNGAAAPSSSLTTLSVTDSLTAGATDVFTGSHALSATDSLAIQESDLAGIGATVSAVESWAVQASESMTAQNAFTATDSLTEGLAEGTPSLSAVLTTSDSCLIQAGEVIRALTLSVAASETLLAGLTDAFTGSQSLSSAESLSVGTADVSVIISSVSASESLAYSFTDTLSLLSLSLATTESLTAQLTEGSNVIGNALISASDSCTVQVDGVASILQSNVLSTVDTFAVQGDEISTLAKSMLTQDTCMVQAGDGFTGSQALTVSEQLSVLLAEDQGSSLPTAASDETATSLLEAASVGLALATSELLAVNLSDLGSKQAADEAVPKAVQDSLIVQSEEGAVTEVAGPYWGGWNYDDHGLVHAGSYEFGRRDNAGKERW